MNFGPLSKIPVIGQLLFQYNWLVYLSIILAIAMAWFLNKTICNGTESACSR